MFHSLDINIILVLLMFGNVSQAFPSPKCDWSHEWRKAHRESLGVGREMERGDVTELV